MKLIIGLGNPGEEYVQSRHNLGFDVVERFLQDFMPTGKNIWEKSMKLRSDIAILDWQAKNREKPERIILAKPKTFMNNSGVAVSLIANFYHIEPSDIWVIHDELDLPLGSMKIRFGGAAAGHHGVESIITGLGTDKFWRFRLGIGEAHDKSELAKHQIEKADEFVLSKFGRGQLGKVRELVKHATDALETGLEKDLETARNRFNTK